MKVGEKPPLTEFHWKGIMEGMRNLILVDKTLCSEVGHLKEGQGLLRYEGQSSKKGLRGIKQGRR